MTVIEKYESNLGKRPSLLQEKVFQHLFETAEIAKFNPEEKEQYEESLKSYRDLKNVIDTAYDEAKLEGKLEGLIEGEMKGKIEVAKSLKENGVPIAVIAKSTGLSEAEIENL